MEKRIKEAFNNAREIHSERRKKKSLEKIMLDVSFNTNMLTKEIQRLNRTIKDLINELHSR